MFHVGQQVVCVDDGHWAATNGHNFPIKKGEVVTISRSYKDGVWFVNLTEHPECDWHDGQFLAARFRPVRKTDISIFTAMLQPVTDKVSA